MVKNFLILFLPIVFKDMQFLRPISFLLIPVALSNC